MFEKIATEVKAGYLEKLETCSQCGEALECADSDTVFMPYCDARGLFYLRDGMAFNPVLLEQVCASCEHPVQTVQVDIIANPDITEAWADKYFCQNDVIEEPEIAYTVALPQGCLDLPRRWLLFRTETAAGFLDRHFLRLSEGETVAGTTGCKVVRMIPFGKLHRKKSIRRGRFWWGLRFQTCPASLNLMMGYHFKIANLPLFCPAVRL